MHSTSNINDGYLGSGLVLRRSIRKYGEKNFKREILEFCDSREMLSKREEAIVTQKLINNRFCMNLALGGEGNGGIKSKDHARKFHSNGGKAVRKILSNRHAYKMKNDPDYRMKVCNKLKGQQNFKDKKHTEDSRRKMSLSHKGKGLKESNSKYGTMWITNGLENKKINKEESIPIKWKLGRTFTKQIFLHT